MIKTPVNDGFLACAATDQGLIIDDDGAAGNVKLLVKEESRPTVGHISPLRMRRLFSS